MLTNEQHTSPNNSPALDEERQTMLRGLGPDDGWGILPLVVTAFVDEYPSIYRSMCQAAETGDLTAVRELAHQLKGAAANLGAVRVTELCHQIELGAQSKSPADRDLMTMLDGALKHAADLLREKLRATG